jgi:hypothetical protein
MPNLSEQKTRKTRKVEDKEQAVTDALKALKLAKAQKRAADRATRKKTLELIGETILLAYEAESMTAEQAAAIGAVLSSREEKPADWNLLEPYLLPQSPTRPVIVDEKRGDKAA